VGEAAVGYTLILITLWSPPPVRRWVALAAAFWIFGSLLLSGGPDRGFGLGTLRRCSWAVGLALAAAAAWIALAAHLGTLQLDLRLSARRPPLLGYLLSSLIQQVILQGFIMARVVVLLRRPSVAIATAGLLFSAAHLPNPLLMLATLLWGMAACWLYLRYRSLIGVAAIHFVLGVCIAICVPASLHHNMRVGLGYSQYKLPSRRAHTLVGAAAIAGFQFQPRAGGRRLVIPLVPVAEACLPMSQLRPSSSERE
jgi:membrane protease YdiL (CAAX protease family)